MDYSYIAVICVVAGGIYLLRASRGREDSFKPPRRYPYKKKMLLTKTEYAFFKVLKKKCDPHQYMICPKVRMEDFLSVTDQKERMKYRGYIRSRHIDFMLCDSDLHVLAGIELDDDSHNAEDARKTDQFKDNVFKQIGVPLYRIKTSKLAASYETQISAILHNFGGETAEKAEEESHE